MTFEVNGFDVSKWQGKIDWDKFITHGDFFIIRAGSINMSGECYEDYQLKRNAELAIPFGKPVSFYWYFRPKFNAVTQAEYFINLIKDYKFKLYPVIDVEEDNGKSQAAVAAGVWQFVSKVSKELEMPCMIYTSPGFWNEHVGTTTWARDVPLWCAQWGSNESPYLPRDWSYHGKTAVFWQWQVATNGTDYGVISKGLDLNRFMGTREEFNTLFGATIPDPDPIPEPTPLTLEQRVGILEREAGYHGWELS